MIQGKQTFGRRAAAIPQDSLQFWIEADTIKSIADGDIITAGTWLDRSINANNPTTDTTVHRPILKKNIFGALPAARYDGVNDYSQTTNPVYDGSGDFTLFMVLIPLDSGFAANWAGGGDFTNGSFQLLDNDSAQEQVAFYTSAGIETNTEAGSFSYGTKYLMGMKVSGSTVTGYRNGAAVVTKTLTGNKNNPGNRSLFIASVTGVTVDGFFGRIDLGACIFYNVATNAATDDAVNGYLTTKYGL